MNNTIDLNNLSVDQLQELIKAKKAEEREAKKAERAVKAEERKALSAWTLVNGQWSYGVVTDETQWCAKFNPERVEFEIVGTIPAGTTVPMASPKHAFKAYRGINSALRKIAIADTTNFTYTVK
jgi:hypothetical protein